MVWAYVSRIRFGTPPSSNTSSVRRHHPFLLATAPTGAQSPMPPTTSAAAGPLKASSPTSPAPRHPPPHPLSSRDSPSPRLPATAPSRSLSSAASFSASHATSASNTTNFTSSPSGRCCLGKDKDKDARRCERYRIRVDTAFVYIRVVQRPQRRPDPRVHHPASALRPGRSRHGQAGGSPILRGVRGISAVTIRGSLSQAGSCPRILRLPSSSNSNSKIDIVE
ncbi:hypothetical protein B0H13DRAFT_357968 [Mycena leptocephala]|nr:hypothetical protein B0H13DRAFT_357968 [Mycena leptocephala]